MRSPCVLNAAGGASDTPFATPRGPYRGKDFQKSRFLRARALSEMALLKAINTHFCMRSRDLNGLATERSVIPGVFMHSARRFHPVVLLCTSWVAWMPRKRKGRERKQPWRGKRGHGRQSQSCLCIADPGRATPASNDRPLRMTDH